MDKLFLLYADTGAGEFSLLAARRYFARFGRVETVLADDIRRGSCLKDAYALIMPGGADTPYCRKLDGQGNENIRAFVQVGGLYIGICAGAYYACRAIEYHKGRFDEICADRALNLYNAVAIGSLPEIAPYYDDTLTTAAVTPLSGQDDASYAAYYFGGCTFQPDDQEDAHILARYAALPETPPAIILKSFGKGRALLSGVHFEVMPDMLSGYYADRAKDDKRRADALAQALEKQQTIHQALEDIWQ